MGKVESQPAKETGRSRVGEGLITKDLENTLPVNMEFAIDPESLWENELGQLRGGDMWFSVPAP